MPDDLYILYSSTLDRYYIGVSTNAEKRLEYHNRARKGWTVRGRPWRLVFSKRFATRQETLDWERWLKQQKSRLVIAKILKNEFDWRRE